MLDLAATYQRAADQMAPLPDPASGWPVIGSPEQSPQAAQAMGLPRNVNGSELGFQHEGADNFG
jgi:hypothetical protein